MQHAQALILALTLGLAGTASAEDLPSLEGPLSRSYCSAACKTYSGGFDLSTIRGAGGNSIAEARHLSIRALLAQTPCDYGVASVECATDLPAPIPRSSESIVGCKTFSGVADLSKTALAQGSNPIEARVHALHALASAFACNHGAIMIETSARPRPAYCVAACKTHGGRPDLTQSQGASGLSGPEAKARALQELQARYSCEYGILITECSN